MRWAGTRDADVCLRPRSVELVRWPVDAARRDELAAAGVPRLLLVGPGVTPPRLSPAEDWIRLPADERDVAARLQRLAAIDDRSRQRPRLRGTVLEHNGEWTIPDHAVAVLQVLVDRFCQLVPWADLEAALGSDVGHTAKAATRVASLRARLAPAGLAVRIVASRGVVLVPREPGRRS